MTTATVLLRQTGKQLCCDQAHASLLDLLEAHQVAVEFQCRSGYCGACRMGLLRGQVSYQQPPLAFIKRGDILPCCCLPTEDIELDV
ncbi:class I ribonucleotide reductase maintenance protein YfaE [Biostraticola tofi]|uniref:Ferredoxin n=1 Tax=Biostraticola tofi TaxID=466109 RepID=A0A4R3Z507_9GAMM|nr:class I ribonucleotide reductase maintenance protein YfaE [Biostraticola tofi]TCW00297.1 ferredoxin [Biostraticola tofi]